MQILRLVCTLSLSLSLRIPSQSTSSEFQYYQLMDKYYHHQNASHIPDHAIMKDNFWVDRLLRISEAMPATFGWNIHMQIR